VSTFDQLFDIHQAAEFLHVSVTSLRRWTDEGRLACLRIGGRRERRFKRADLEALMESQPSHFTVAAPPTLGARSGHAVIGGVKVPYGSHFISFYSTDEGRAKLAACFLADGLGPGSVAYLVAEPDARRMVVSLLRDESRSPGLDGHLVQSDYCHSAEAQIEYWETAFLAATRAGAQSLRVVGDVWAVAKAAAPGGFMQYEADYERLLAKRFPVVTMCQYDVRKFSGLEILSVLSAHRDTFAYPVERLIG